MTDIAVTETKPAESEGSKFFKRFIKRKTVAFGLIVLIIFVTLAVLAPWIAPYSPSKLSIVNRLKPPGEMFWFGTDEFGRDVFSRTIYSARLSLLIGASVVVLSAAIGVTLGLLAGFFQRLDTPIARLIDAMMAFPDILLAIALVWKPHVPSQLIQCLHLRCCDILTVPHRGSWFCNDDYEVDDGRYQGKMNVKSDHGIGNAGCQAGKASG